MKTVASPNSKRAVMPAMRRRTGKPESWELAAEFYLAECEATKGLSPDTLENYRLWLLGPRMTAVRESLGILKPDGLSRELLIALEHDLRADRRSAYSVLQAHRVVITYAKWLIERGWLEDTDVLTVATPRTPTKSPEVFSEADEAMLLRACNRSRDRLLIRFLIGTGLRVHEAASVQLDDIVSRDDGWFVHVRQGKGRKDRYAPLGLPGQPLGPAVAAYIELERPLSPDHKERHLWLSEREPIEALTAEGVFKAVSKAGKTAGIHAHPHRCRHTWATRALASGVPAAAVQRAGGWSTFDAMSRYLHFATADVAAAWNRAAEAAQKPPTTPSQRFMAVPLPDKKPGQPWRTFQGD